MTKDVEHVLKCLSAILDSSVESSLFRSVLHFFLIGLCDLLVSNFLSSLYVLEIRPLSDVELVSFPFCRLSFCLVDHVLCFTEAFQCQEVSCINFISLSVCVTWVVLRKWFPVPVRSSAFDFIFNSYFIIFEL